MEQTLRTLLCIFVALAAIQCGIFGRLLLLGPGGELMDCMNPPCQRQYPLWLSACTFAGLAAVAVRMLIALRTTTTHHHRGAGYTDTTTVYTTVEEVGSDAFLVGAIAIACSNVAIDAHWMHPIPHAGKSLNPLMHSNVTTAQQAMLPAASCVVSIAMMVLCMIIHRTHAGICLQARTQASEKQK